MSDDNGVSESQFESITAHGVAISAKGKNIVNWIGFVNMHAMKAKCTTYYSRNRMDLFTKIRLSYSQ